MLSLFVLSAKFDIYDLCFMETFLIFKVPDGSLDSPWPNLILSLI